MLSKGYRMRRTFILSRRLYAKTSWKIILYLAVILIVVKIVRDIAEVSVKSWSQEKLILRKRKSSSQKIIGSSSFVAGKFLEDAHPVTNLSHCNERWTTLNNVNNASGSPELGFNGPYRVIYDVISGSYTEENKNGKKSEVGCVSRAGVTFVTHATPEYLYHIAELLGRWEGPLTLAVYAPGTDAELARYALTRLCRCLQPNQAQRLSVHFVFHVNHPPDLSKRIFSDKIGECGPPSALLLPTYRTRMSLAYPINVCRNAARAAARTPHILVSDVELLPSEHLASQFCSMLSRANRRQDGPSKDWKKEFKIPLEIPLPQPAASGNGGVRRLVFVVPVFEVELGEKVPDTKEKLISLIGADRAFYFHRWQCVHCQKFPGIHLWLDEKRGIPGNLQIDGRKEKHFMYTMMALLCNVVSNAYRLELGKGLPEKFDFCDSHSLKMILCAITSIIKVKKVITCMLKFCIFWHDEELFSSWTAPLVMVRREFPYHRWEPIYIGTNREPLYSEVLSWEGQQDKMTQMHQMCLLGYHFVVLDRAFLVHTPGVKRAQPSFIGKPLKIELDAETKAQREWMKKHEKRNAHFYEMIVESMNLAHPRNPKCKTR